MVIDPYLWVLIIFVLACAAVILLFLLAIVILRYLSYANEKRFQQLDREWEEYFLKYSAGELTLEETIAHFRGDVKYSWMRRFFQPYLETLDGDDFERTKDLCRETGMINHYQKMIVYGTTPGKATAARILGSLRCRQSISERLILLESRNPIVVQAAAQGLAVSGELETFSRVAKALLNNTYFTYEGSSEILAAYGREICKPIIEMLKEIIDKPALLESYPGGAKPKKAHQMNKIPVGVYASIMVDLLGHYRYSEALPVLNKLLEIADEELTVHILKAFVRIGEVPENFDVVPYLSHRYWVVRNFAVQTCRISKNREAIPVLEKLLEDMHWWVRYHSALSLLSFGRDGYEILKHRTACSTGTVSDIGSYVLERGEKA